MYEGFDKIMILSTGRVAFTGKAEECPTYFAKIGEPFPPNVNPAEFLLDVVNREFTDPKEVDRILDAWEEHREEYTKPPSRSVSKLSRPTGGRFNTSATSQTYYLLKKHLLLTVRDPTMYLGRFLMFMFTCCFFSIIYIEARKRIQEQVLFRMFLIMWHVGVPSSLGVITVFAYNQEFNAVKREVKNGMYSPLSYLLTNTIIQIPMTTT